MLNVCERAFACVNMLRGKKKTAVWCAMEFLVKACVFFYFVLCVFVCMCVCLGVVEARAMCE